MSIIKSMMITLSLFILCAAANAAAAESKIPTANNFFKEMESVQSMSCSFSQAQIIAGLRKPIHLNGNFHMDNSGNLAWIVKSPIRFFCIIYKGRLTSWDEETKSKNVINLNDHPAFATMINMMKAFFAGKISVEKDYDCSVFSAQRIILRPLKHLPLSKNVSEIEIVLSANRRSIEMIRISACNGDRSTINFRDIILDVPIPGSVWKNGDFK